MARFQVVALALLAAVALAPPTLHAARKTVCTITVNSPDEKDFLQRTLPRDEFDFVELVERGRPDWLAASCRKGVRCDVLLISGHFDGGTQFYSDRLNVDEYLPVHEMERVACSDSCPGLFSQLKEVYLLGCNTLNPEPIRSAGSEIERSLMRAGYARADAAELSRVLGARHAESNRDRMRNIFKDVPVIYGFSSKAPLGPSAASTLQKYFPIGAGEFGSGRPSARLLSLFAPVSMTVANGASDSDPQAGFRRDVCHFADDRLPTAQKLRFVHRLLRRDSAEVRLFLDHIERFSASLSAADRQSPAVESALDEIGGDLASRARYLEFARDADEAATRSRMLDVARSLGWLSETEHRSEMLRMIDEHLAGNTMGSAEVDLFCAMNKDLALGSEHRARVATRLAEKVPNAAVLACLGYDEGHARVLRALTSADDHDVEIAQVYLRHRPITDAGELRALTSGIARMHATDAQVRALDTLARQQVTDPSSFDELIRLFAVAKSLHVQRAVAGILIRADYKSLGGPDLARRLGQQRLRSADGADVIDVLIRRLQAR